MSDHELEARRLAGRIGLRYSANEPCDIGAPFYAFTKKELDKFVRELGSLRQVPEDGARTIRLDLSVFDQPGDPRSNLIARGWTPPKADTARAELPELPNPWLKGEFGRSDLFTAAQMRAYAELARRGG